jgi:hypothetical protein
LPKKIGMDSFGSVQPPRQAGSVER